MERTTMVFMTPPVSLEERYGPLAHSGNCTPCLALLILSALARKSGYSVAVIDAAAEGLGQEESFQRLKAYNPKSVGFSTTTLTTFPAHRFAQLIKDEWPDTVVVLGGPHATAFPEGTLEECPSFDMAAIHEGENTILQILEMVENGNRNFHNIHGIAYRDSHTNTIQKTPPGPMFQDMDSLPFPAWDLLPGFPDKYTPGYFKVKKMPSTSFVSSRGCPFECSFCDTSVFGQKIRTHSAEYMADLFEHLNKKFGIWDVTFEDDTFMVYRKNVERFCHLLLERNLKMSWACNSRVNLAKPDLLSLMKRAGCWHISYGIESGSQEILDHESKKVTLDEIETGIKNTAKTGIAAKGFFIVGHPRETQESLQATYELTQKLPFADISVTCMTPFPGSPLSKYAHDFGQFENDWTQMNLLNPVFVPYGLSENELVKWQRKILRDFYFKPSTLWSYSKRLLCNPTPQYIKGLSKSVIALTRTVFSKNTKPKKSVTMKDTTGVC